MANRTLKIIKELPRGPLTGFIEEAFRFKYSDVATGISITNGYVEDWVGSINEPSDSEIDLFVTKLYADNYPENRLIQEDRKDGYPSIGDQLDMQYWDSVNGTTTWADAITAVKEAHPKP